MIKGYIQALILMILFILTTIPAYADGILFTKSEFTREGFEQDILRSSSTKRGWWELSKRNICVLNPDGTGFKQLTDDNMSYHARWSFDGQKIAFLSGPSSMMTLNVMNADGSNRIELLSNQSDIYDYRWSPDGTKILLFVKSKMNPRNPDEAWVLTISNSSVDRMGNTEWAKGWNHWAPEGAAIVNPNNRFIKALPSGIEWPEWSHSGNYIAFLYDGRLAIADVQKTGMPEPWKPTRIEPPCDRIGSWSWSSNDEKLLFFASGYVCSVNSDGKNATNLSMSSAKEACWSPDGSQIAFTTSDGRKRNSEIFIANADGNNQKQLTNTNYFHEDIDWK
jgi:Tol biopolymer transport system component